MKRVKGKSEVDESLPLNLPEDPKEAQALFNSLSIQDQLDIILRVHGQERVRYLFLSEHPEQLVHQIPELEVFLTIKEVGEKDCLELISLTTPEQFQYILDLDFWKKDQLEPEKILYWMELLIETGVERVIQFIQSTDLEFITLILKKFLEVYTLSDEHLEGMNRIPLFTLDQFYFIEFKGRRCREIFEPFLKILYRTDQDMYRRLMDALIYEIESELEETGYRFRKARLNDYGFPDFEEALEIYQFIHPDALLMEMEAFKDWNHEEKSIRVSPFLLAHLEEGPFFSSILSKVEDPKEQNRLRLEITSLCNKALVAEAIDLSHIAGMERVVKKVYHTLNLGLQYLSRENERKAFEILQHLPVQKIFQCGVSLTLLLRKKAESLLKGPWFFNDQKNLGFLDPPFFEKLECLLKRRPACYQEGGYKDFSSLQEIKEAEIFLDFLKTITEFIMEKLKVTPQSLMEMDLNQGNLWQPHEITLSTVFLTSLANQILNGTFQFRPIEGTQVKELFSQIFEKKVQGKGGIKKEIKKGLVEWLSSIEKDESKIQHLITFQNFCLDLFEVEYGRIPPEEQMDTRYLKGLLVKGSFLMEPRLDDLNHG